MTASKHAIEAQVALNVVTMTEGVTAIYDHITVEDVVGNQLPRDRVWKLWEIGEGLSKAITPHSACKNRCSMCCHQAVTINGAEAAIIASTLDIAYNEVPQTDIQEFIASVEIHQQEYRGIPCPFLVESKCSIYGVRPMSCRTHFNVSSTPSLCDTSTQQEVPNLNFTGISNLIAIALGTETWGDIRNYFPEGINTPTLAIHSVEGESNGQYKQQGDIPKLTKS